MRPTKYRTSLTGKEKSTLEQLVRNHSTPQNLVRRARIILLANDGGKSNKEIAEILGTSSPVVTKWSRRWMERASEPIEVRLSDSPRPGSPEVITPEQWCKIIALACELPENHGRPITHWSYAELADEAMKQGIVEHISTSHLFNFLKKQSFNPIGAATG